MQHAGFLFIDRIWEKDQQTIKNLSGYYKSCQSPLSVCWAILNGEDPTQVLARSELPILSPELDWERCDTESGEWANRGLTPLVIFVEGWKKIAEDTFLVWYQGCDSTMGLAELKVFFFIN
ncbi:unnamed protein product [Rotaria sp. Silwood2]|nr:unnamed protein product [Rotaria sp. Silwood2]